MRHASNESFISDSTEWSSSTEVKEGMVQEIP